MKDSARGPWDSVRALARRATRGLPAVGQTPHDVIWTENKWRLLRFRPRPGVEPRWRLCALLHDAPEYVIGDMISPFKAAGGVSRPRLQALVGAIRDVLGEAIAAGGSTLRDFAQTDGALGYFQHRFRVYDREGRPCPNPGCAGVIARKVQAGRSTFYCPTCQR